MLRPNFNSLFPFLREVKKVPSRLLPTYEKVVQHSLRNLPPLEVRKGWLRAARNPDLYKCEENNHYRLGFTHGGRTLDLGTFNREEDALLYQETIKSQFDLSGSKRKEAASEKGSAKKERQDVETSAHVTDPTVVIENFDAFNKHANLEGAYWDEAESRWLCGAISSDGTHFKFGYHDTPEEAADEYKQHMAGFQPPNKVILANSSFWKCWLGN